MSISVEDPETQDLFSYISVALPYIVDFIKRKGYNIIERKNIEKGFKKVNKTLYIYCFINKINNKKYIGSTTNTPARRYQQHLYCALHEEDPKHNYPLYCAIRKYGIENFDFIVLQTVTGTEQDLRALEQKYIIDFNSLAPNGYNQTLDTNHPINDPKTYEKISNTKREQAKRVAEVDQTGKIIQIWRSIADCAEETKLDAKKIGSCCRGERKSTSNRFFNWLNENDQLLVPTYARDPYKGEKGTTQVQSNSKAVKKLNKETLEILKIYPTIALAARENNCDASGISKACRGLRSECGGFKWEYQ